MRIDFDVNQIVKITYRKSSHLNEYVYKEATKTPKYKKFLWIKWLNGFEDNPEGFYYENHFYGSFHCGFSKQINISETELVAKGYIILDKQVYKKAYVEVSLGYKSYLGRSFDSDKDAEQWIDELKQLSEKTFETIGL